METMDLKFYTNYLGAALFLAKNTLEELGISNYQVLEKKYQDLEKGKGFLLRISYENTKWKLEKMRRIEKKLKEYEEKREALFSLESSGKSIVYEEESLLEEKIEEIKENCPHSVAVSFDEFENFCICCGSNDFSCQNVIHLEDLYFPMSITNREKLAFAQQFFFEAAEANPKLEVSELVKVVQQKLDEYAGFDVLVYPFGKRESIEK